MDEQVVYSQYQFDRLQKESMLSAALGFPEDTSHCSVLKLGVPGFSQGLLPPWSHILKVSIIVYFKYYIKYQVKMTRILLKFFIYPSCETALKNGTVISKIVRKSSLNFTFDQGSGLISEFLRSNSNNAVLVRNNNLITIWYFSWWVLFVAWYG